MKIVSRKINRFGVRKYDEVKSFTQENVEYVVAKIRKRNTRNYKYICDCPNYFYRQKSCKHIAEFKKRELIKV